MLKKELRVPLTQPIHVLSRQHGDAIVVCCIVHADLKQHAASVAGLPERGRQLPAGGRPDAAQEQRDLGASSPQGMTLVGEDVPRRRIALGSGQDLGVLGADHLVGRLRRLARDRKVDGWVVTPDLEQTPLAEGQQRHGGIDLPSEGPGHVPVRVAVLDVVERTDRAIEEIGPGAQRDGFLLGQLEHVRGVVDESAQVLQPVVVNDDAEVAQHRLAELGVLAAQPLDGLAADEWGVGGHCITSLSKQTKALAATSGTTPLPQARRRSTRFAIDAERCDAPTRSDNFSRTSSSFACRA